MKFQITQPLIKWGWVTLTKLSQGFLQNFRERPNFPLLSRFKKNWWKIYWINNSKVTSKRNKELFYSHDIGIHLMYHENRKALYVLICNSTQFILCNNKGHLIMDIVCHHLLKGGGKNMHVYLNTPSHVMPLGY